MQGPAWATVSGIGVEADEVEALVAEVRKRVAREKQTTWWLGPSSRPHDLEPRLRALGLADPVDGVSSAHAVASVSEPCKGAAPRCRSGGSRRSTTSSPPPS